MEYTRNVRQRDFTSALNNNYYRFKPYALETRLNVFIFIMCIIIMKRLHFKAMSLRLLSHKRAGVFAQHLFSRIMRQPVTVFPHPPVSHYLLVTKVTWIISYDTQMTVIEDTYYSNVMCHLHSSSIRIVTLTRRYFLIDLITGECCNQMNNGHGFVSFP